MAINFSGALPGFSGGGPTYTANEGIYINPVTNTIQLGDDGFDPSYPSAITTDRYIVLHGGNLFFGDTGDVADAMGSIFFTIASDSFNPNSMERLVRDPATGGYIFWEGIQYNGRTTIFYDSSSFTGFAWMEELTKDYYNLYDFRNQINVIRADNQTQTGNTDYWWTFGVGGISFSSFGTSYWKLGDLEQAGPYNLNPAQCLLVEVGGVIYRLATLTM